MHTPQAISFLYICFLHDLSRATDDSLLEFEDMVQRIYPSSTYRRCGTDLDESILQSCLDLCELEGYCCGATFDEDGNFVPSKKAARGMASSLYTIKKFIKNRATKENAYCSFTEPEEDEVLDCERLVGPEACGYKHTAFGPELMFAHRFPTFDTRFQNRQIRITKVARGGSTIRQWMKKNAGSEDENNYWTVLKDAIHATKDTLEAFVWFQGENDAWEHISEQDYLGNLTEFVSDVRNEILIVTGIKFAQQSEIPVIIVEIGKWGIAFLQVYSKHNETL